MPEYMEAALLKDLDELLSKLVIKRNELAGMAYADPKYDTLEDEIHELEDDFNDEFGDNINDILESVHDDLCPDTDILLPTAYLAKKYKVVGTTPEGLNLYDVEGLDGVPITLDKAPNKEARLVIIPGPFRLVLMLGKQRKTVWEAGLK
jgi:hypothetical protein